MPAPSLTTARSMSVFAAASSSTSPPTERPRPPTRPCATSGRSPQEGGGRRDVGVHAPAEPVRVALALSFAAPVEEEYAVAVAHEHSRVGLRPGSAREGDHCGTVLRRDVPPAELEPVGGGDGHILMRGAEICSRHAQVGSHV